MDFKKIYKIFQKKVGRCRETRYSYYLSEKQNIREHKGETMEHLAWYELLLLFFAASFLGWVLETAAADIKQKKFVNRGLVTGPFCVMYGITTVLLTVGLGELRGIWLFLFSAIYATVVEWIGGHLIERLFHQRWWDYSGRKWNLDGYICLSASAFWGVLGFVMVTWGNDLLFRLMALLPLLLVKILLLVLAGVLVVDILASYILLRGYGKNIRQWEEADNRIRKVTLRLQNWIGTVIARRIRKAYPKAVETKIEEKEEAKAASTVFAAGCSFYKIVLLFFCGAFLGDLTETVFCRITAGVWMSRSSVVWGPFSIVWGLAIALVTALLYKYKDRSDSFLFGMGTFLGGAYEYLCSVFTELVFGKVFWDYSEIPFNLGGRINLLYCFFWGIAAVVWFKLLYPRLSDWIEKIPMKPGKIITWALILFMCCNIVMSCMALIRYDARGKGVSAENTLEEWIDEHYDDARMQRIYPNAITAS